MTNMRSTVTMKVEIRGCTGFDGDFELMEAIRGPCTTLIPWNLNTNADEKFALAA